MDSKKELQQLVKIVKAHARAGGNALKNEEIAKKMGVTRTYLSDLLGVNGHVTEKHVIIFKEKFKTERVAAGMPTAGDKMNPLTGLLLAFLDDYIEWKAEKEGISYKTVKGRITRKAESFLGGLESWLPED